MAVEHRRRAEFPLAAAGTVAFFLVWQVGIVLGAAFAPPTIADRLATMSPTIPLHHETRNLADWLLQNNARSSSVIVDDLNWESAAILRFAPLDPSETFH